MPFNHYAKVKRILKAHEGGWHIRRIDEPTSAKTFGGETRHFDHYYRAFDVNGDPIPYCKFQQLDLFARTMKLDIGAFEVTHHEP